MMYNYEKALWSRGYKYIAGCDEVGRGPLAGPIVVAAVVLDSHNPIEGLNDSKALSEKQRNALAKKIYRCAKEVSYVIIPVEEVDSLNVLRASKKGMYEAIKSLTKVDYVLSDAMPLNDLNIPSQSLIKGDSLSASIAAASIIAKTKRDQLMVEYALLYPEYGFEQHKGYPTKKHLDALSEHGICEIHRKSFKPVQMQINKQTSLKF